MTTTINTATATRPELVEFLKAHDAYEGRSRDTRAALAKAAGQIQGKAQREAKKAAKAAEAVTRATSVDQPAAATDPVERLTLAKAEHKILKAWVKDGERPPRPATPNLDALEAKANGVKVPKAKAARAEKVSTPTAVVGGDVTVTLRTERCADIVMAYVPKLPVTRTGPAISLPAKLAEGVYDEAKANGVGVPIFDRRVLDYFTAELALAVPSVGVTAKGVHNRLVILARQLLADSTLAAFEFSMKLDGTLRVEVTEANGQEHLFPNQKMALAQLEGLAPAAAAA